jgi:hypothetical protein
MRATDVVATQLAVQQHCAFARWQLLADGVSPAAIKRRVASGAWVVESPGVYSLAGSRDTFERRLWVAWLAAGPASTVSHEAAAQLRGVPNVVRGLAVLTNKHGGHHRLPGIIVHQYDDVLPNHVSEVDGLPVTTVERTIVDLGSVVREARLLRIVEDSKHLRLTTYVAVGECLASVARRGKPGVRKLARVLDTLIGGNPKSMSVLERDLFAVIDAAGLARPIAQFPFPGRQFTDNCVDSAYVDAKLVIEVDGRAWHTRIGDIKRDHDRDADAARNGWQTLRLLHEHVATDPAGSGEVIRDVLRERLIRIAS